MKTKIIVCIILLLGFSLKSKAQKYIEQTSGVTERLTSVCMTSQLNTEKQVWVCGWNGTVLKTTNEGTNWISVGGNGIPSNVSLQSISCKSVDTVIAGGSIGPNAYVYRSSNGGLNWTQVFFQTNGFIDAIWMKNGRDGFMYGNPVNGRWSLWKTTNGGVNWDSSGMYLAQNGGELGDNALVVLGNKIWFGVFPSGGIYYSSNYGTNWTFRNNPNNDVTSSLWFYHQDSSSGFLGGFNAYSTTNGGVNWTIINPIGSSSFLGFCSGLMGAFSPFSSPVWAIRHDNNIYRLNGNSMENDYTAPSGNYNQIAYDWGFISPYTWAVRTNGGITKIRIWIGGAVQLISTEIPKQFSLQQNYPNPFNPNTKIRFAVSSVAQTFLSVYDLLGREVATLVNEQLQPGTYEIDWNAENFSSGVYYYTLQAGTFFETKKMILIK